MNEDDYYERGKIVWHSTGEDEGPVVGMSLGLGDGRAMWVGEITRSAWQGGGEAVAALGSDGGWWLMVYPDHQPLAKFADAEMAQNFFYLIAGLMTRPSEGRLR